MVKKIATDFTLLWEKNFGPYYGSSLAITAAFLTGLDIERKIGEMVKSVADQKKGFPGTITWANGRISFCKFVIGAVTSFIKDLNHCSKTPYFSVMSSTEGVPNKKKQTLNRVGDAV